MNQNNIEILKYEFKGEIILPDSDKYENASIAFIHKGTPAIILRPLSASDIAAALKFAQNNSMIISVRSGGHSGAGFGTNKGGVVIDLSAFNKIEILDKKKNLVRIGTGAIWHSVAAILHEHGLAISSGDTVSVGVGGLTLGGGIGLMVRKYGLTIDSLVSAEVVTADGKILRTSENENPDLFWAIRGGGGNFGIVTNFEFTAYPLNAVFAGIIQFEMDKVFELLKGWGDYMRSADEALTSSFNLMPPIAGNPPAILVSCCYAGDDEAKAMDTIKPIQKLGKVVQQNISKKNYPDILEEGPKPEGVKLIVKNGFVENPGDDLIKFIAETGCKDNSPVFQIRSMGGAMNRVKSESTAFHHRNVEAMVVFINFAPLDAAESEIKNIIKPWEMISSFTYGGCINFFSIVSNADILSIYPEKTLKRLSEIKRKYDPNNIFNQNFNIPPAHVES